MNVDLFWVFMLNYTKGWGIREHKHDFYQLYMIMEGCGLMNMDGEDIVLDEGKCIIIPPGKKHELYKVKSGNVSMIDAKFHVHDDALKEALNQLPTDHVPEKGVGNILITLLDEFRGNRPHKENIINSMLSTFLYSLIRDHEERESERAFYSSVPHIDTKKLSGLTLKIAEYVSDNCDKEFSLDDMARELSYNRNYLCKVFKQATGLTIVNYANSLRIRRAMDLLQYSTLKISDISESAGFNNVHYFSKVFKEMTGHTPGEFRNRELYNMYEDEMRHGAFLYRYFEE